MQMTASELEARATEEDLYYYYYTAHLLYYYTTTIFLYYVLTLLLECHTGDCRRGRGEGHGGGHYVHRDIGA